MAARSPKPEARSLKSEARSLKPKARKAGAFTLVEMLVVISIIAILVAVVIGVAGTVRGRAAAERTRTTMATLVQALQIYCETITYYPVYPTDNLADGYRFERAKALYSAITSVPKAQERVRTLPKEALISYSGEWVFADAFGRFMDYRGAAGRGGVPLLQSAGPDGKFDTADDVFSDGR